MSDQPSLRADPEQIVRERFRERRIAIDGLERRDFPDETIFVVRVASNDLLTGAELGNEVDIELNRSGSKAFVVVRASTDQPQSRNGRMERGVADERAVHLLNLLTARARTSEIQPSLSYVRDSAQNLLRAVTPRHHLIFGRRGAGKTALMVETKRYVQEQQHFSVWVNLQTHRKQSATLAYLWISKKTLEVLSSSYNDQVRTPAVAGSIATLLQRIEQLIATARDGGDIGDLVPSMQSTLSRFLGSTGRRLYLFLDDLHYLSRDEQPLLLDLLHGSVRDCDAWMKVASIKHLTRWFTAHPPTGLQTGHDADHIDLDVTLENPSAAKVFLEDVLKSYSQHVGIKSVTQVFSTDALDRLVIAAGAVPRDYLVLSASAIRQAQQRDNARLVGVQDVNKAAGENAKVKIAEIEDDAAAQDSPESIIRCLEVVRAFCLDQKKYSFFRIDFTDREARLAEYGFMQDLMDLRLIHLVNSSLSDEHAAGKRAEVFLLDLSQYSGERLKKHLKVLDFQSGHLVLKDTGTTTEAKRGDTPKRLLGLLRRGPLFPLSGLVNTATQ